MRFRRLGYLFGRYGPKWLVEKWLYWRYGVRFLDDMPDPLNKEEVK